MKFTVIISEKDPAGMNIFENLLEFYPDSQKNSKVKLCKNIELVKIKGETLYADHIDTKVEGDIIIFATRHRSEQEKPCFCVHTPGNWGETLFGGKERELCISPADLQSTAYNYLKKNNNLPGFQTCLEVTHHGPILNKKPCIFIEIGSSQNEWKNKTAGKIIAKTILETIKNPISKKKTIVGLGGPHYCDNFSKLIEKTEYAVGHVCPKYMLFELDSEMIKMAINRTYENYSFVVLDWKGLGKHKKQVQDALKEAGVEYKKIKELY